MTDEELRRKAAVAIRLALNADTDSRASEALGDAIVDVQARERS
jgi:hypothetical protein